MSGAINGGDAASSSRSYSAALWGDSSSEAMCGADPPMSSLEGGMSRVDGGVSYVDIGLRSASSDEEIRASLEGKSPIHKPMVDRSAPSLPAVEARAVEAMPTLANVDGRLMIDGLLAPPQVMAHRMLREGGLSLDEALAMDGSQVASALRAERGLTSSQARDVERAVEMTGALRVAMDTRTEVLSSLANSRGEIADARARLQTLEQRVQSGERVGADELRDVMTQAGIASRDQERLLSNGAARVGRHDLADVRGMLDQVSAGNARMTELVAHPSFDTRTLLHDERFTPVRDAVLTREGVSMADRDLASSVRKLGRPADGRQMADDVMFGVGFAGPAGKGASMTYSVMTFALDASRVEERAADTRALFAAGMASADSVSAADGAGRRLMENAVTEFIAGEVLSTPQQLLRHVAPRLGL